MMGTVTRYNSEDVICIVTDGGTEMPEMCSYPAATWLRMGYMTLEVAAGVEPLMGAEGGYPTSCPLPLPHPSRKEKGCSLGLEWVRVMVTTKENHEHLCREH